MALQLVKKLEIIESNLILYEWDEWDPEKAKGLPRAIHFFVESNYNTDFLTPESVFLYHIIVSTDISPKYTFNVYRYICLSMYNNMATGQNPHVEYTTKASFLLHFSHSITHTNSHTVCSSA